MGKNGGRRPGAGRPKGSLSVESKLRLAMQAQFCKFISTHKKKIWDAQLKLALGVFVPVVDPLTKKLVAVAQKPPDGMTLAWMQEQMWGRAPQRLEIDAEIENKEAPLPAEALAAIAKAVRYALPENRRESSKSRKPDEKAGAR